MSKALEGFRAYQVNKEKKAKRQGKTTELTKIYDSDIQAQPQLNQGGTQAQTVSGSPLDAFKSERGLGNLTNAGREWYANRAVVDKQRNDALRNTVRQTLPAYQRPVDPITAAAANMLRNNARGNIDLYNRPEYRQPDGSISTVNSISIGTDEGAIPSVNGKGLEVLIPTIGRDKNGRPVQWTDEQAIENYRKTGENLGKFNSIEDADKYAEMLHRQQEAYYSPENSPLRLNNMAPRPFEVGGAVRRFQQTGEMNISPELKKMMDEAPESGQGLRSSTQEEVDAAADWTAQRVANAEQQQRVREMRTFDRHNPVIASALQGTGLPSMLTAGEQALARLTGNEEAQKQSAQIYADELREAQGLQARHPLAYNAGNVAGNIATVVGIGKVIGAIPAFANMSNLAQAVVSGAGAMGGTTAIQKAGAASTGMISPKDYALDIATGAGAGAAGGAVSSQIAGAGMNFLRNHGLTRNALAQTVVAGLSSSGYSGAGTAVRQGSAYLRDPENYQFDAEQAAKDAAVAFAFGAFSFAWRNRQNFTMNQEDPNQRPSTKYFDDCKTPGEIDSKLRQYARQYHPDQPTGNADLFAEISAEATAMKAWMNVNNGAQAYQRAQEAYSSGDTAEYQAAQQEYNAAVNALMVDVQSGAIQGNEAVEALQILQSVSANLAGPEAQAPATSGSEALAALADQSFPSTAPSTAPSTVAQPSTTGAEMFPQAQGVPGNPYEITAAQKLDTAVRQLQALEYERNQHPSVEQLNDELNSPFAVFENENPEIAQIQTRTGEQKLAALAAQATENQAAQKRDQIQAIYEAGKTQNPDFQTVMDSATMLTEAEKTDAFYRGLTAAAAEAAGIGKEISYGGQQQEEGNYLSGERSGRNLPLSAGERDGGVPSEAGGTAEGWQNWTAAADPDLRGGREGAGSTNVTLDRGVLAEEVLRTAAPGQVIYPVKEGGTPKMRKAQARINAYDPDITQTPFVSKGDLLTDKGEYIRAFVDPAKRQIGFRINDEQASSDKVGGIHEVLEIANIDGKLDLSEAEDLARHIIPGRYFNAIVKAYQNNGPTRIGIRHAIKEALFDITAGINQFEGVEGYGKVAQVVDYAQGVLYDYFNDVLGGVFDAEYDETAAPAVTAETAAENGTKITNAGTEKASDLPGVTQKDKAASVNNDIQYSVELPYAYKSKAAKAWVASLEPDAKKYADLFMSLHDIGINNQAKVWIMSKGQKRLERKDIAAKNMLVSEWNNYVDTDKEFADAAKKLAAALPDDIRKEVKVNLDGKITPTEFDDRFKLMRSFMQRVVDSLPAGTVGNTTMVNGKEVIVSDKKSIPAIGGEEYRKALLEERRKQYREGTLKKVALSSLSGDNWGTMGFLATNTKTIASGDFTTFCPQMYYGSGGCWYCYRLAALRSGTNNKLVGQNVWYTGEILRLRPEDIKALNSTGGLRIQSFGDWLEKYTPQLLDLLVDAETVGLQVKVITKEPSMIDAVAMLKKQGYGKNLYFNLSADYTIEKAVGGINLSRPYMTGVKIEQDESGRKYVKKVDKGGDMYWKRALTVEEASKYRKKYPWVNVRIVATNIDEFIRGLESPDVQVVTGYHGDIKNQERISSENGDVLVEVEHLGDNGMPIFRYNQERKKWVRVRDGKLKIHKRLADEIEKRGLQYAYYVKTCCQTGRCADCKGNCGVMARDFAIKNATNLDKESVKYWDQVRRNIAAAKGEKYTDDYKQMLEMAQTGAKVPDDNAPSPVKYWQKEMKGLSESSVGKGNAYPFPDLLKPAEANKMKREQEQRQAIYQAGYDMDEDYEDVIASATLIPMAERYKIFQDGMKAAKGQPQYSSKLQLSKAKDSKGNDLTTDQDKFFKNSAVRDKNKNLKPMYHGTSRADRVGTVFRPERATSGPMAFFTDDESIAQNYARDKEDTSLKLEGAGDYHKMFRMNIGGKAYNIDEAWNRLPAAKRAEIRRKAPHITMDDDYENIIYDKSADKGLGNYDNYLIRDNGGNYIKALVESWLDDGTLYGDEGRFKEVLSLAGIDNVEYLDPEFRDEKVYAAYLNVTKPLDTSNIPKAVIDALEENSKNTEWNGPDSSVDMWDKTGISPQQWFKDFKKDLNNGTAYVWTRIPDWVTDTLKEMGYDGISDTGGKRGGATHNVVIPFYPEQIKSVYNQHPTDNEDIRYSSKLNLGPKYTDYDENVEKPGMNVSYSLSDDGKRIAISPESYMNDATWKKVHNAINRLGYGMPSVEITKQYVLGGYNLQPDQTEAVKKIFGISDGEPAAETDIKAAKATASKAAKHFGVTRDLKKAAYLTVNGTMLDFSEGQGRRTLDHRSISQILDLPEGHGYSAGMIEFMNQGNIRLQSYGIDISKEPNQAQRRVLRQIIEDLDGEFVLDISNERGDTVASVEYPEGTRTAKILADIDRYFKEGTIPEQDSVSQFHMAYSSKLNLKKNRERDMEYDAAVKNNDMESAGRLVKEAADQAGYKLAVYHGTGETFTEFNRGAEGIHVGNREQAEQIAKARFDHRSKTTQYVWGEIRDRVPEMDREQRDSLVSAAYTLGDYFDAGPDESWFDGDIMDDSAVTEYVDHMAEAYKKGTGREAYLRMRTFDRKTGENVMGLYAKINNPMVINGDIVSWTPADIADVLVARNRGEGKIRMWYRDKDTDISGSEIKLSEDDLQYIENIQRTNNEEGWDLLSDVLFSQGYDGIQYRNEFEGDKQSWSYIALNPSDVKSADPITYNNAGNVIPLSERFNQENNDIRYSSKLQLKDKENDYAPTFYSKLQREIQNYKGEKIGAASVESYLKGKGVKDEEIKWSGIRTFLESKKSVSKQELMDYLKANELVIEEKILGGDTDQNVWSNGYNTVHIDRYYDPVSDTEFKGEEDFRKEAIKRAAEDHIKESEIYFNISNDYMSAETEDGDMILEAMLPDEYELRDADYEPSNGTRWGEYILDGGANYREILFSIPGSDYTNQAMQAHWRSDTGVLAHARVQDFESNDGGKVLFVEEIQSDWHNAGQKNGYQSVTNEDQAKRIAEIREDANNVGLSLFEEKRAAEFERIVWKSLDAIEKSGKKLGTMGFRTIENSLLQNIRIWGIPYDDQYTKPAMDALTEDERLFIQTYREDLAYQMERETEADRAENAAPDAPFRNNYTDFVLKDLLHMAAEGEYDYLAWTTGKMQEERWSDQYAEGYRIEYDQQIPKFLKKYGRQWGAGLTEIGIDAEGPKGKVTSAPAIVVNDAMKKSVLTEGQPMYSTKLNLNGREVELTDREEELMDQLNSSYLDRIDEITQQKDAEIAALQEKMERAVGEEKKKARDRLERLRKQKNDRIAYLEKQWRENTNRRIADLKEKAKNKLGEQHDDMMRRLAKLQAQKDKKIEDILAEHRRQRQEARDKRNDHKLRVKFQKLAQRAVRDSKNKPGMASQRVQELLKDIDLKALGMRDETKWELRRKYQEILEMKEKDENYAALFADRDMKKVERLFKTQINEMSVEDINDLITELSALAHYQENTDRLLKDSQGRSAAEVGRQIVKDLKELSPLEVTNPVKRLSAKYLRDNLSPERAFNRLSGYKHDNAMKAFYRTQVLDGLTKVKRFEQKADELKQEFINDEKNKYFLNNGSKQTIPVTDKYGRTAMISPAMRVSLYMASKNTDNLRHIATDGVTVPEPKTYAKGMIEDAYGRGTTLILDPTDVKAICNGMTDSEKEFATLLKIFFDTYAKDAINETSVDLDGILRATVENYFPITSDKNFLAKSMDSFQDPTLEGWNNLKSRQENANNRILLEDARQVLQRHIRNTARYHGLAVPMRNWSKVYGYTSHRDEATGTRNSVQSAIKNAWDADTADYIERLIRDDINSGGRKAERGIADAMRSAYAGATLTLNPSVALKQTTSYLMAGSILDSGSLMYGLAHGFTKKDEAYMDSITPWGWARRQGESTIELGDLARKMDPITKNTPNWNQAMDVWTTNRLFLATEESVKKEFKASKNEALHDLKRGDKKYDDAVAERYNQVLWRTQPQYEAAFRPEYLRKTDVGSRTFGMFKTESMQMSGELIDSWGQWRADSMRTKDAKNIYDKHPGDQTKSEYETNDKYRKESAKQFYRTFTSWVASNMLFAIMGTALNIGLLHKGKPYRNEKGEIDFETIAKKTALNFAGSSLGGFFYASTAADIGAYLYGKLSGENPTWYDIEVPGISLMNDAVENMGNLTGVLTNEEANNAAKAQAIAKFALAVSKFTPVGFAENIVNLANSVVLYNQDVKEGTFGKWEAGKGLLKDTSPTKDQYANRAVDAARKGDMATAERALKKTKKANLEKAVGRPITENMYKKIMEDPNNLRNYLGVTLEDMTPSIKNVPDHGYSSFTKLREDIGDPERTQNWHHIVEQEQMEEGLAGFKSTQVNNTNNIVSIPSGSKSPHSKISEYYGSVQDFTDGKTVREWLKDKSFEEQWEFGVKQLREYGDLVPTTNGWVFVPDKEKMETKIPMNEGKTKEKTDTQRSWESRIAEAREDGSLKDNEIRTIALDMIREGISAEEAEALYRDKKKKEVEKLDKWIKEKGTFEDYLKGRNAISEAAAIKDKDKEKQAEKKKKAVEDYLRQYHGSYANELWLWELAGYSENTFEYH